MLLLLWLHTHTPCSSLSGDLEEDEKLQAQTAEEVQRAQRDVKRVMAQMREELLELERLRDSDVRVEYGLSLRILGSDKAPPPAWKPVRLASSMSQSACLFLFSFNIPR